MSPSIGTGREILGSDTPVSGALSSLNTASSLTPSAPLIICGTVAVGSESLVFRIGDCLAQSKIRGVPFLFK